MEWNEQNPGYRTFVFPSDPYRYEPGEGDPLRIQDLYKKPKDLDQFPIRDLDYNLKLYPGQGAYVDPEIIRLDTDIYHDFLVNSVVSRHLCNTRPLIVSRNHNSRFSVTMDDIDSKVSKEIINKSLSCSVRLKRSMPKNNRYIFEVTSRGGSGPHVVTVKAEAKNKNMKSLEKADLYLSCSCPFWIYYGPEYHARRGGYLEGKPKGTATPPRIRDPKGTNLVCKHVYAVFNVIDNYEYRW